MLRIQGLKKTFGARLLFEDASYHFPNGERIALVGANGAGKTTLLNIICGLDTADDGEVLVPRNVQVGYLPQKPNAAPAATVLQECESGATVLIALRKKMEQATQALSAGDTTQTEQFEKAETAFRTQGGYALEAKASAILRGLGFKAEDLAKHPTALSGGWRMRLELARLFIREPDFLILDEPTNHLDLPSLVWVESYLQAFRGTLLFVSHDRALLNRLSTLTLHLANRRLTAYKGNFEAFLDAREEKLAQEQAERDQLKRRREAMETFVERFGAKATKATQAQSRLKMIARIRDLEEGLAPEATEASVFIDIPEPPKVPRIVYRIERGSIGYTFPLAKDVSLELERGAKVAIIGANGIGKSTLLRTIAGRLPPLAGVFSSGQGVESAYFSQDQTETLDSSDSVLSNLLRATELGEREARSLLGGFLFRGDEVQKRVSVLSGGEQSRLGLACALAKKAGLLLLDEPTNHLDMTSVETLAASLEAFAGTALFVSHDRTFIDAVCTHVFAMLPDGRSMLFEGKLDDYGRLAELAGFPNVLKPDFETRPVEVGKGSLALTNKLESTALSNEAAKDLKRERQRLEARVTNLDREMLELRQNLARLEQEMATLPPMAFAQISALHANQQLAASRLEDAELEWLSASEEIENLTKKLSAAGRD